MPTTLVTQLSDPAVDDGSAIAELRRLYALQRKAFRAAPYPYARPASGT